MQNTQLMDHFDQPAALIVAHIYTHATSCIRVWLCIMEANKFVLL